MNALDLTRLHTDRASGSIGEADSTAAASKAATATHRKGEQVEASPAEQAQRKAEMRTQGRKGCKAARIHMAFSPANHAFMKSVAAASGVTLTQVVNKILDEYRAAHPEYEARAKRYLAKQLKELGTDFTEPPAQN